MVLISKRVRKHHNRTFLSVLTVSSIGTTKRVRDSVDSTPAEEPGPGNRSPPSAEPSGNDVPPAKRRKTVSPKASISRGRGRTPKPLQSRVVPPARENKITEPTVTHIAGQSNEDAEDSESACTLIDDAGVETRQGVRGAAREVNTEAVGTISVYDESGDSSDDRSSGKHEKKVFKTDAEHDGDVESETEAVKKLPAKRASRKGKQIDTLTNVMLTSS